MVQNVGFGPEHIIFHIISQPPYDTCNDPHQSLFVSSINFFKKLNQPQFNLLHTKIDFDPFLSVRIHRFTRYLYKNSQLVLFPTFEIVISLIQT